jgi:hypothetical protein
VEKIKKNPKEGLGQLRQPSPREPQLFGPFLLVNPCQKVPYNSKIDALTAVATLLKYEEEADWMCFRAYFCSECKKFHLTKALNE